MQSSNPSSIEQVLTIQGRAEELSNQLDRLDPSTIDVLSPALLRLSASIQRLVPGLALRSPFDTAGELVPNTGISGTAFAMLNHEETDSPYAAQIRASERRERTRAAEFAALMDAVPVMIWITRDPQSKEVIGNRFGYEFLRMHAGDNLSRNAPQADLARQTFRVLKNGRELTAEEMPMQITAASGIPIRDFEEDLVFDDGSVFHLIGNVTPLFDGDGNPSGAIGAFLDITSRKEMELALLSSTDELRQVENDLRQTNAALSESEERFRWMAENIPQLAWMADQSGGIFWYNQRWFDYTGGTLEEMEGWGWQKAHDPEHVDRVVEKFRHHIEIGEVWEDTFPLRGKDGEYRWFLSRARPLRDAEGNVVRWFGTNTDVTEMRRLELENLEQHTQMEVQRQLLDHRENERQEIARDIHDGPIQSLVGILFNIQLEKEALAGQSALPVIEAVSDGLRKVIQELRDVVNDLRPPVLLRFGLARAIRIFAEDFRQSHPELNIELDLVEDANLLNESACLALYRVVQECLNNIIRHAQASQIWVRYSRGENVLTLEIKDNGRGFTIPSDWLALARKNHYGIAGMRERIEAIGGKFKITSHPGKGTSVKITVPAQ